MKHLIFLFVLVFIGYFGWYYLPDELKEIARKFRGTHLFKIVLLILVVLFAFMLQATFGSAKFF